jgi:hypothetical protein
MIVADDIHVNVSGDNYNEVEQQFSAINGGSFYTRADAQNLFYKKEIFLLLKVIPSISDSTISFSTPTPTTAVITYGTTTNYGTTTTTHPLDASHIFLLTPLDDCTTYHYVIGTKVADDVVTTSADHTFKTL